MTTRGGKLLLISGRKMGRKGIKKFDDLVERARNFRFRKFKIVKKGRWIQLWGEFNPWVLEFADKYPELPIEVRNVFYRIW